MFKPYSYHKEESRDRKETRLEIVIRLPKPKLPPLPKIGWRRWLSVILMVGGMFLLADQLLIPLLTTPAAQKPLLRPLVEEASIPRRPQVLGTFVFNELKQAPAPDETQTEAKEVPSVFYLTVPKLKIKRAEVETNSLNLSPDDRLGHYYGSALPGRVGNTFIYGHSSLPIIYDPQDYRTIFTKLDELETGDEFTIEFGKNVFKYRVEKKVVLEPKDVKPLESITPQFLQQAYVTLMTCVPPGLKNKRLLVQARLIL
jgi:LPXTG-site transpeptidase (sortase) family protein